MDQLGLTIKIFSIDDNYCSENIISVRNAMAEYCQEPRRTAGVVRQNVVQRLESDIRLDDFVIGDPFTQASLSPSM